MNNTNDIINWIQDFNVNHNVFEGIDLSLQIKSAQEIINECDYEN